MLRNKNQHNLLFRLLRRECIASKPCTQINNIRRFCEVIVPADVVPNVELPDLHVCKFTPSGRFLVCYSTLQHELLLFAFTGLQFGSAGDAATAPLPPRATAFSSYFQLQWRAALVSSPHMLCKDFCLALHEERYLVVAAQSPPSSRGSASAPSSLPLVATTTIFLVSAADGRVTDRLTLDADFVHLSHNAGVAVCGDRIAVLGLRSQTIRLLQVLPDGRFAPLTELGRHLAPDDALVVGHAAAAEQRWRSADGQAARQIDERLERLEAAVAGVSDAGGPAMRRVSSGALGLGSGGQWGGPFQVAGGQAGARPSGMDTSLPGRRQLLHAPNALAPLPAAEVAPAAQPPDGGMITGLRQRLLAYLCLALRDPAAAEHLEAAAGEADASAAGGLPDAAAAGGTQRRDRFLQHFDAFQSLVVWKAQFLDAGHLLLALGSPDASALRHAESQQQAAFLAVFSLAAARVLAVLPNSSPALLEAYLRHAGHFHGAGVGCGWERFLTPGGAPSLARAAVDRQMAHAYWTPQQVTRRVLAALPPTSQVMCASPYLDACLFQYDEKLISPVIRPRALSEVPLKFVLQGRREAVRFKLSGGHFEAPQPSARPHKQLVTWHFHPVLPFAMGVLQTSQQPPQVVIYHRI